MNNEDKDPCLPNHLHKVAVILTPNKKCTKAVLFGARCSQRSGASLLLIAIIDDADSQAFRHWMGVGSIIKEEAKEEAKLLLEHYSAQAFTHLNIQPQCKVLKGEKVEAILALLEREKCISTLVFPASTTKEEADLLATMMSSTSSSIPIAIVPENASDQEMDLLI